MVGHATLVEPRLQRLLQAAFKRHLFHFGRGLNDEVSIGNRQSCGRYIGCAHIGSRDQIARKLAFFSWPLKGLAFSA